MTRETSKVDNVAKSPEADHSPTKYQRPTRVPAAVERVFPFKGSNAGPSKIKSLRAELPVYPIGVAAKLLNVHPRTLRLYESEGLVRPAVHDGPRMLFSENDINWTVCLRSMIHEDKLSIPGLRKLLQLVPCWEIKNCDPNIHKHCPHKVDWAVSRTLHLVGTSASEKMPDKSKRASGRKVGNV
ncbi:MAG: MerR family transcriptional regulator [Desulfobulbaceae bacterium]|nr:MerR family transcriptional regulator [Desulfobulbaceae bacterium]